MDRQAIDRYNARHDPAPALPPVPPHIESAFTRYIEPDGPTFLRYQDQQTLDDADRRFKIRQWIPRDAGQYLEREIWREQIEADAQTFDQRRQAEHELAWQFRVALPAACPERTAEFHAIADKLESCRLKSNIGLKPDGIGKVYAWKFKCSETRLCPDESHVNARRIAARNGPEIEAFQYEHPMHDVHYAVFTIHNYRAGTLALAHDELFKLFIEWMHHSVEYTPVEFRPDGTVKRGRVRKIPTWPQLQGALAVMEDPLSARGDWNVHINAILLMDRRFDYREALAVWRDVVGAKVGLHLDLVKPGEVAGSLRELIKYAAKVIPATGAGEEKAPGMVEWPPERLLEWWDARQYRRVRGYGRLYAVDGKCWDRHNPMSAPTTDEARTRGQLRLAWLEQAGIKDADTRDRYLLTPWKEIPSDVKPQLRAAIARGDDYLDMDSVTWIGSMEWSFAGYSVEMHGDSQIPPRAQRGVDLITGDKSGAPPLGEWHKPPIREGPAPTVGPPAS